MEYTLKVNASAVSHVGKFCADNEDNFYVNGRFVYDREVDNIQVSIENSGSEYLFAVSDGMDREIPERSSSISVVKELKKLQDKFNRSEKQIEVKIEQMSECVEETSSLIYSTKIGEDGGDYGRAAFAGLLISGNTAAAINVSNCRVYLLRRGSFKLLSADYKKTERLLKMGIITDEQAEKLSDHFNSSDGSAGAIVKKSQVLTIEEGDIFLLCTNGLTDAVDEDRIYEILSTGRDTGYISYNLVREAIKNGGEDNVTALVVNVESVGSEKQSKIYINRQSKEADEIELPRKVRRVEESTQSVGHNGNVRLSKYRERQLNRPARASIKRQRAIQKFISTAVACVVIAASFFGAYKLWGFLSKVEKEEDTIARTTTHESSQESSVDEASIDEVEIGSGEQIEETAGQDVKESSSGGVLQFPVKYTVQKGDTLYQLSRKFYNDHTKYKLIMEANNLQDPNQIKAGQILTIPKP